ncbi:MAG TPA: hypothetical protein VM347_06915 [Nonomuraea sp.]|nr:hypothetical protein [Nonomuraea sp.]
MLLLQGDADSVVTRAMTDQVAATLCRAMAVNASAYQLAAAFAAWLGGRVIDGGFGLRSLYLVGAAVTVAGIVVSCYAWFRDREVVEPGSSVEAV